ncbi:molecular chaperone TorD family protein [bacterium]|nr:molecular chaperone TorD family protein [bacterium]
MTTEMLTARREPSDGARAAVPDGHAARDDGRGQAWPADAGEAAAVAEAMRGRRDAYLLMARLFRREVDDELLQALRAQDVFTCEDDERLGEALGMMRGYLAGPDASTLDLARDYAKAFCGAGSTKRSAAYPFESVYTSEEGMLMQDARDGALAWYRRFGLTKAQDWHDCEDHLALELEFVAVLANDCLASLERHDGAAAREYAAAQRDFVGEHLADWLPAFDRDVDRKARTSFYRGLARFTSHYVRRDLDALRGLLAA